MERETRDDLVELGTASGDTHGSPVPTSVPEEIGYRALGLSDE